MPGHVFIVPGDIRNIACDAWLVPCSVNAQPNLFLPEYMAGKPSPWPKPASSDPWWSFGRRVLRVEGWPSGKPQPWMVNIGFEEKSKQEPLDFYTASVNEALTTVLAALPTTTAILGNRKHRLLAVPFLGSGKGMPYGVRGELLNRLLTLIRAALARISATIDVALVVIGRGNYAAAQNERRKLEHAWDDLDKDLQERARLLAQKANQGRLALFLGAGVGVGAGQPTWQDLLKVVAKNANLEPTIIKSLFNGRY